jgi:hypothetical protein
MILTINDAVLKKGDIVKIDPQFYHIMINDFKLINEQRNFKGLKLIELTCILKRLNKKKAYW